MHAEIAQFLRYLDVERNASDLTIKSYREDLMDLADFLTGDGQKKVVPRDVDAASLRVYVSALHDAGYARTSIARKLASLRSFYRFAQRQNMADTNPAKPLRNPRGQRKLPHFLTGDEINTLLGAPDSNDAMGLRDIAILEVIYSAGLRVSEVVGAGQACPNGGPPRLPRTTRARAVPFPRITRPGAATAGFHRPCSQCAE